MRDSDKECRKKYFYDEGLGRLILIGILVEVELDLVEKFDGNIRFSRGYRSLLARGYHPWRGSSGFLPEELGFLGVLMLVI